jgi:hypothetical protein
VDAQPGVLGQDQQLGVEEPARVAGQRQQRPGPGPADRLEAALGVGEPRPEHGVQQQVVAAGQDLPARAADHPGAVRQPGPDGHVAVPGQQRRDQREQCAEVRRQVDIHAGQDVGVAAGPDGPQRAAAAGLGQPGRADPGEDTGQRAGRGPGPVGAAVVGNRDTGGEGEPGVQESVQPAHARSEIAFLVHDRDDDLDLRRCPAADLQRVALLEQLTCHADTLGDQPAALLRPASAPAAAAGRGPAS